MVVQELIAPNSQVQEALADPLEVVQEITQAGPYAFHRVAVYTGTVGVTTSVLAYAMVDRPMVIVSLGEMVDVVSSVKNCAPAFTLAAMMGLIVAVRTFSSTARETCAAGASWSALSRRCTKPRMGGRPVSAVARPRSWIPRCLGTRSWRSTARASPLLPAL